MNDNFKTRSEKIQELIDLANTSEEELEKMSFKERQKIFKAKSQLCHKYWDSSKGTYVKPKKKIIMKNKSEIYR